MEFSSVEGSVGGSGVEIVGIVVGAMGLAWQECLVALGAAVSAESCIIGRDDVHAKDSSGPLDLDMVNSLIDSVKI